ncbi:MAG: sensor histidine kinase [Rectinemataceae bacterium]|nr:sensor histidine kinase [Spirochaetaceae bacterium]
MHASAVDFVLDLVQNSVEAGASLIDVEIDESTEGVTLQVSDNGCGMDAAQLARALDPFRSGGAKHPSRKVGLGLPFLKQAAELAGGEFRIESVPGRGTMVRAMFPASSVDSPPLGDVTTLFVTLLGMVGECELVLHRKRASDGLSYTVRKSELAEAAGDLATASGLSLVRQFLASQEEG